MKYKIIIGLIIYLISFFILLIYFCSINKINKKYDEEYDMYNKNLFLLYRSAKNKDCVLVRYIGDEDMFYGIHFGDATYARVCSLQDGSYQLMINDKKIHYDNAEILLKDWRFDNGN